MDNLNLFLSQTKKGKTIKGHVVTTVASVVKVANAVVPNANVLPRRFTFVHHYLLITQILCIKKEKLINYIMSLPNLYLCSVIFLSIKSSLTILILTFKSQVKTDSR